MFDPELTAFLESGCSTIVGLVTPSGEPYATRGWGTEVLTGPGPPNRVRLLVGTAALTGAGHGSAGATPFAVAFTGADVRTLRSVQLKGTAVAVTPTADADLERCDRFCADFFDAVEEVDGISPALMQLLVPGDLVAVTIDVVEMYDQTPGPGAGAPLVSGTTGG